MILDKDSKIPKLSKGFFHEFLDKKIPFSYKEAFMCL